MCKVGLTGSGWVGNLLYQTTDYWHPEFERSLLWNDPAIGIKWPFQAPPQLAAKDAAVLPLQRDEVFD